MADPIPTGRAHLKVHPADNVTTLLDERTELQTLAGGASIRAGIPFGHKVAIAAIPAGGFVVKYGVPIGRAISDIPPGEHVHVHNCR